jgi:hypothetical protein
MAKLTTTLAVASGLALFAAAGQAGAVALFQVEANPSQKDQIKLSDLKSGLSDTATVDGVNAPVATDVAANFASGDATIKPLKDGALLTDIVVDPANNTLFNDFSFRGQDLVANQEIFVTVTDQVGATQTFSFTVDKANQDFTRFGIVGLPGETIDKIEIQNSGGFKEAKQFAFSLAQPTGGVPEPASWALMIVGVGLVGTALRSSRRTVVRASLG